jgi:hypothetical protein
METIFVRELQHVNKKLQVLFFLIFLLITFKGTFTSFFKDKKPQRSHKIVGINVFLTMFA